MAETLSPISTQPEKVRMHSPESAALSGLDICLRVGYFENIKKKNHYLSQPWINKTNPKNIENLNKQQQNILFVLFGLGRQVEVDD
ncbi:hypothetical protein [Bordetella trematum]|uniref:hypothetical protein n=1 Tax=Bordetella trematum TaxID=123899 RepID=UPI0013001169|nr:hypothetical protein [Bordetella trematum]